MLPKVLRTIFLALGLAMVWLAFFYQYELKKQPEMVQEAEAGDYDYYGELDFYTLADDNYTESDEALSGLELMPLHITDFSISISPYESWLPKVEQEQVASHTETATKEVQEEQLVQEAGISRFPLVLAAAGVFLLFCGVLSCRLNKEI